MTLLSIIFIDKVYEKVAKKINEWGEIFKKGF